MFGLSIEKLVVVLVFAAIIVGPARLPGYARRLAETLRALRTFVEASRRHAEEDLGLSFAGAERALGDLRQYTPRRLLQDALAEPTDAAALAAPGGAAAPGVRGASIEAPAPAGAPGAVEAATDASADTSPESDPPRPVALRLASPSATGRGQRYAVSGSAAHPRRLLIAPDPAPAPDPASASSPAPAPDSASAHASTPESGDEPESAFAAVSPAAESPT